MTTTRIAIIDDQEIFLDSLRLALEIDPHYEVVATFNSGITALQELNHPLPDIVLMDFSMPDQSGLVTYPLLRERWPELAVIGMSGLLQVEPFALLWSQGINGLVHKSEPLADFKFAIEQVASGRRHMSAYLSERVRSDSATGLYETLTPRERGILLEIGLGKPNKQISTDLGLSLSTVRRHRENLMAKIDAHSTADIIGFCLKLGLIGSADTPL